MGDDLLGREKIENYLKTIYRLRSSGSRVKGVSLAAELNVSRPTVCVALRELRDSGYVISYDDGSVSLTKKGIAEARDIEDRFNFLTDMLTFLNVDETVAAKDACRLEHNLSDESYKALRQFFGAEMTQKA